MKVVSNQWSVVGSLRMFICVSIIFNFSFFNSATAQTRWVDSVMNTLLLEERIAQLMVVRVPLDMDDEQAAEFSATMNGYKVGGVCFILIILIGLYFIYSFISNLKP